MDPRTRDRTGAEQTCRRGATADRGWLVQQRVVRAVVRGQLRGQLALLQQAVEDAGLRHGVDGAGRQQVRAQLGRAARRARPQQRRPEHRRQVVQGHFVLALVLVHPGV